jgi:hypothetical protein
MRLKTLQNKAFDYVRRPALDGTVCIKAKFLEFCRKKVTNGAGSTQCGIPDPEAVKVNKESI